MKLPIQFFTCLVILVLSSCSKNKTAPALQAGSVSIQGLAAADTLGTAVSVTKDSLVVIGLKALLNGQPSTASHHIVFDVDTTQLAAYQAKYGTARLLPSATYLFYQPNCSIPAGATLSDSAELNLVKGSTLRPLTTYVLPVIIRSVDGQTDGIAPGQVLYLVVHTGKSLFISKADWTIVSSSSDNGAGSGAVNVLDNDDQGTWWLTSFSQSMPQYVTINFNEQVTFSGVTYRTPSNYYNKGYLYPTSIKIELSADGTNWTDMGTFGGQTSDATQTINTGISTAQYLRFTVLAAVPLSIFNIVAIGGIGLAP